MTDFTITKPDEELLGEHEFIVTHLPSGGRVLCSDTGHEGSTAWELNSMADIAHCYSSLGFSSTRARAQEAAERFLLTHEMPSCELREALIDINHRILCPVGPAPTLDQIAEITRAVLYPGEDE